MSQYEQIKKKKSVHRRARGAMVLVLLAVVFTLWAIYAILQSDLFNLKQVEWVGLTQLTEEELLEESGLILRRSLFKYDLKEVAAQIEVHPYVKQAVVKRVLPATLQVVIEEREEFAILSYAGSYLVLDDQGVALTVNDNYLSQELPLITGAPVSSFKLGAPVVFSDREDLTAVLRLLEAARLAGTLENISEINVAESDNIKLITFAGHEVLLGEAEDPVYLMLALQEVLVNLYTNNRRNVMIDMRYRENITVKDKEP